MLLPNVYWISGQFLLSFARLSIKERAKLSKNWPEVK